MSTIAAYRLAKIGVEALDAQGAVLEHITRRSNPVAWAAYQAWLRASTAEAPHIPLPMEAAAEPTLTPEEIVARLAAAVQIHLDATARQRNYDNIRSAALRAAYPGPWQAEGIAYAQWMDACWAHAYQVQADVAAGLRTIPTASELIAELPTLELP